MIPAPIPENENDRLKDLYDTGLLDTPNEEEFNDIVKFASELCNTPISLISLVDSNRQWFKARVGIDIDETDREIAFCSHAILQDGLFEIPDTLKDNRFIDNPLVVNDPSIRFYAGMPLVTSTGSRLGTLCVIDNSPGQLTEQQKAGLKLLANNVIKIAELRIKNKELHYLTETQKRIISILAHDVRNPLASFANIIDLKKSEVLNHDEAGEMVELIKGQLANTIEMVENIVNWGKQQFQFGNIQLDHFNLYELVESIFKTEALKSWDKNNQLQNLIQPGTIIHSDKQALKFILRNLVSNSNKFTESGSISINSEVKGLKTLLVIKDTGVGMTPDKVEKLFNNDSFATTLGTNEEKGSGLGLILVKEFIDRMDGVITVESHVNKGTIFKITI